MSPPPFSPALKPRQQRSHGTRMSKMLITTADRCEYIFYRGLYRTAYARVSRSTITDTELQIGQFVVPRYGHAVVNDTEEDRYLRAWKEQLPEEHVRRVCLSHRISLAVVSKELSLTVCAHLQWFPMEYYSPGQRGHFYHVFNTVRLSRFVPRALQPAGSDSCSTASVLRIPR